MRVYRTTNERQFNEAFNALVGTHDVEYSQVWPMTVRNGKEYLAMHGMHVGQIYASQLLHGKVSPTSCLAPDELEEHMTPRQRAYLSHMHDAKDPMVYTAALHACSKYGAIPSTAMMLFDGTTVVGTEVYAKEPLHSQGEQVVREVPVPVHVGDRLAEVIPLQAVSPIPIVLRALSPPPAPVVHIAPAAAMPLSPVVNMDIEPAPTPTRVRLNSPKSAQRSIALQPKSKRVKKR